MYAQFTFGYASIQANVIPLKRNRQASKVMELKKVSTTHPRILLQSKGVMNTWLSQASCIVKWNSGGIDGLMKNVSLLTTA